MLEYTQALNVNSIIINGVSDDFQWKIFLTKNVINNKRKTFCGTTFTYILKCIFLCSFIISVAKTKVFKKLLQFESIKCQNKFLLNRNHMVYVKNC